MELKIPLRDDTIKLDLTNIKDILDEYPMLTRTVMSYFPELSLIKTKILVALITQVCPYCYESAGRCRCWDDS